MKDYFNIATKVLEGFLGLISVCVFSIILFPFWVVGKIINAISND